MPIHWDKAKGRWQFSYNRVVAGKRYRLRKRLPRGWSRAQADQYDAQETARLHGIASGIVRAEPLIEHCVIAYVTKRVPELRNGKKAAQELAGMRGYYIGRVVSELPDVADKYIADHADLAPATVRNRLAYLRAAVRFAWKMRIVKFTPPPIITPQVRNERHLYLRHDDQAKLLELITDDEARALFTLAYYIGARWRAELLPRTLDDVERVDGDAWLYCGITKNGKRKMKWVHPDAHWCLAYLPWKYGDSHFYRIFRAARKAYGMPDLKPHDSRHSLASQIISGGGTLEDVRGALGQESLQAAQRYSHLYPERVKSVLSKIGGKKG